jgi:hypothetical protein
MLAAYFDESYSHKTKTDPTRPLIYTVAGWISTVERWRKLRKEWMKALRQAQIPDFHMKDYEWRQGVYADWVEGKRIKVLRRLHWLIKEHVLAGVSVSVNITAFNEIMTPAAKKDYGKTPYGFDARLCLRQTGFWADRNKINEPIHYVFAHQTKQGGELNWIFDSCLKNPETRDWFRLNSIWSKGFANQEPALQAADIIAYEINKHVVNYVALNQRPTRKSYLNLYHGQKFTDPMYYGKKELRELVSKYEPSG